MAVGALQVAGANGGYWASSTYALLLYAYFFHFGSVNIYSSNDNARWLGFTGRMGKSSILLLF